MTRSFWRYFHAEGRPSAAATAELSPISYLAIISSRLREDVIRPNSERVTRSLIHDANFLMCSTFECKETRERGACRNVPFAPSEIRGLKQEFGDSLDRATTRAWSKGFATSSPPRKNAPGTEVRARTY